MSRQREILAYLARRAHVNGADWFIPVKPRGDPPRVDAHGELRYPDSSPCEAGKFPGLGSHAGGQSGWHPLGVRRQS
jgi:hypothetical protein